jgi:hypothetical protein
MIVLFGTHYTSGAIGPTLIHVDFTIDAPPVIIFDALRELPRVTSSLCLTYG